MSRANDLTGSRVGKLLLLERKRENKKTFYYCKCDCGNEKWIRADNITSKKHPTRSCGCLAKETLFKAKDISGERFGRLIAINSIEERDRYNGSVIWECKCDCGNNVKVSAGDLTDGRILSCGCLKKEHEVEHGKEIGAIHVKTNIIEGTNIKVIGTDKPTKANTSGYKGVLWDRERGKWKAEIIFKKKKYYLGRYDKKEDAIKARKEAEEKLHKEFLRNVIFRPNMSEFDNKKINKGGRPLKNFKNKKVGKLTVLKIVGKSKNNGYIWRCQCECGNIKDIVSTSLISGNTLSCGCYQKEEAKKGLIEKRKKNQVDSTNLGLIASDKVRKNNTSGVPGVYFDKQKKRWRSYIRCQGKNYFLGLYDKFEDAVKARKEAEERLFKPIIEKHIKEDAIVRGSRKKLNK